MGKIRLTPPPVAPWFLDSSFQTVALVILFLLVSNRVPPQASTGGRHAGKSTCSLLSPTPSVAPSSPAAAVMVTPTAAASVQAASMASRACWVQESSGPPQLIEITDGLLVVSWTAVATAS